MINIVDDCLPMIIFSIIQVGFMEFSYVEIRLNVGCNGRVLMLTFSSILSKRNI